MTLRRGAVLGAVIGGVITLALVALAMTRSSPGGAGENWMWLLTYGAIWGLPTSFLWALLPTAALQEEVYSAAIPVFMLLAIPLNWAMIGAAVGWGVQSVRRRIQVSRLG